MFHSSAVEHPWSHEPKEHDRESLQQHHSEMRVGKLTVHHDPFTVRRQVQPWEQAVSLEPYHNPESDSAQVTDSAQVSQEQLESFHHAMSRLSTSPTKYAMSLKLVPRPTETVETFSRFVHLSVLWLVIKTAVLVLCMLKNERLFKGTKWLPDAFF